MAWADKYVSVAGGGAHDGSSAANAWTLAEAVAAVAAGDRINIIADTYAVSADLTFATAGTTTTPIWWRGYKTAIGDLDTVGGSRIPGTDLPLISTTNTGDQVVSSGAHQIFSNLAVASICTDTGGAWNATGGNQRWIRCQIVNSQSSTAARAISLAGGSAFPYVLLGCRLVATITATQAVNVGNLTQIFGCYISGGATAFTPAANYSISYSVIAGFGTSGVLCNSATLFQAITNCTIYAAGTNGILVQTIPTTGHVVISNTLIGGCTNGINNSTAGTTNGVTLLANQFYGCTNNIVGLTEQADVTADLTASLFNLTTATDPWVAKASADFNLASGATAKAAAFPGVFDDPSGTNVMTGYPDIGAIRHQDPAAGGGGGSFVFGG